MTAFRYVPKQEFTCVVAGFDAHIKLGPVTSPKPIGLRKYTFPVTDLTIALTALATCPAANGSLRGIVVHYGLDTKNVLDLALQFVCLEPTGAPDTYSYKETATYYLITSDKLVRQTNGFSVWNADSGERYRKNIVIRPTDKPDWRDFKVGTDVTASVCPYDGELDLLIAQNGLSATDLLELIASAEPTAWSNNGNGGINEEGYHQMVCWKGANVVLDDTAHTEKFKFKAADLSGSIPPGVPGNVELPQAGLPRRPGC